MRIQFLFIFTILLLLLCICGYFSLKSKKSIGKYVAYSLCALIPPVIGNAFIIGTQNRTIAMIGYYIYFIGMDIVVYTLMLFTIRYCNSVVISKKINTIIATLICIDCIQYALNPITHHAFDVEKIFLQNDARPIYYKLVSFYGQTFHRVVAYGIFVVTVVIFIKAAINASRIQKEKYNTIILALIIACIWETFYVVSRVPINRSMISLAVCGLLVFYFAIIHKPIRLQNKLLVELATQLNDALFFFDETKKCIWMNQPGAEMLNVKEDDFDKAQKRLNQMFPEELEENESQRQIQSNEKTYIVEKKTVKDSEQHMVGFFISVHDNTEDEKIIQAERYIATHDILTGLYTKEELFKLTKDIIKEDNVWIVGFADINNFKLLNDIFGNQIGDCALKFVARWIESFTQTGICGRISSDKFGFCIPKKEFDDEKIQQELTNLILKTKNIERQLIVHLGIYEVRVKELEVTAMYDRANMALSTIKNNFQIFIAYYDDDIRKTMLWNEQIAQQLDEAIENGQIQPYLQPIVNKEGTVIGAEALVRWIHPTNGTMPPVSFIPCLEENGMISKIDKYIWECVCKILSTWEDNNLFISINISPKDFYFINVPETINEIIKKYNVNPNRLRVEITETIMTTDIESNMKILNELRKIGFIIEMDDFGSGYSSLNLLKDMPVDVLKIDMKFLEKTDNEKKANTILYNIIHMSEDLGISPLTEGVETQIQYNELLRMGCKMFQGYYFAKPMPVDEFEKLYKK